jgi:hypothetical protein
VRDVRSHRVATPATLDGLTETTAFDRDEVDHADHLNAVWHAWLGVLARRTAIMNKTLRGWRARAACRGERRARG